MGALFALIMIAFGLFILYLVIKTAVVHGINESVIGRDVEAKRLVEKLEREERNKRERE